LFVPDFVALLPVAKALASTRLVNIAVWLLAFGFSSVSFGAYLLTVYGGSP
jgi:hypothetical protein